jgi:outer membrane lipoprotein
MKRTAFILTLLAVVLAACAPVLSRELMREGTRDVPMNELRDHPEDYKGRLFILGGVIVGSKFTETGTQIEALYVPVDSSGYLSDDEHHRDGRFLAFAPKAKGLLDPAVYKRGREITLAAEFVEARRGKIDDMEYVYPVFEIKQIYLWSRPAYYYYPYPPDPFFYDPWGMPYRHPWPGEPW